MVVTFLIVRRLLLLWSLEKVFQRRQSLRPLESSAMPRMPHQHVVVSVPLFRPGFRKQLGLVGRQLPELAGADSDSVGVLEGSGETVDPVAVWIMSIALARGFCCPSAGASSPT